MIRVFISCIVFFITAIPSFAEVKIQEVTSPNGIKAWLVSEPSIPMIAFDIAFRGGASLDNDEKSGATYLMAATLEEGTGDMDAAAFLRASESMAARFGFSASRDSVSITAEVLKSNAAEALDLLKQAITKPAFNKVAVDRVKGQILSGLASDETDPDAIAGKAMRELSFPNHPYARGKEGTIETVQTLTPDDMRVAHQNAMALDRIFIGVVGDVTAEELGPMLDILLGDLPATGAPMPTKTPFGATGGTTVVEFDTPQAQALWAQAGLDRHDPDFFAAYVMNRILGGGGFTSRLTEEVREKRGLTYGVYSYIASGEFGDYIGGSVASANGRIKEALDVIRVEWARMADSGVTADELEAAKTYLTGAYPLRFDGNSQIAGILAGMQSQDLPIDYIATRNDQVNAVTMDDVSRVAKRLLKTDELRFVVVGKPEGVASTD
ncbi:peptidase M16 [Amylibacter ulvae]|uniref:Peptidase M16 n=1 Tax=Paramylibacter ulvae TaxID=1651968 RepID=A0ABQ3D5K1_9RHOB|nr:pitrilysin family protein [Amylibacter ulvae]GHA59910.1 peptidase M16 [Amylibacter ulvae]